MHPDAILRILREALTHWRETATENEMDSGRHRARVDNDSSLKERNVIVLAIVATLRPIILREPHTIERFHIFLPTDENLILSVTSATLHDR